MSEREEALCDIEIAIPRVHAVLYDEFNAFQYGFDSEEESHRQDFRSKLIQFFLTFAPEIFPASLAKEIALFVVASSKLPGYPVFGWHNLAYLNAGLFAYTGKPAWLDILLDNLGHHSSSMRSRISGALAPCSDLMDSFDPRLIGRIEHNLSEWHFGNDMQICLFIAGEGEMDAKESLLQAWIAKYDTGVSGIREARALSSGGYIANPLAGAIRATERYVLLRLAGSDGAPPVQAIVNESQGCDAGINATVLEASTLLARLEHHRLGGQWVELRENSFKGDVFRRSQCGERESEDTQEPESRVGGWAVRFGQGEEETVIYNTEDDRAIATVHGPDDQSFTNALRISNTPILEDRIRAAIRIFRVLAADASTRREQIIGRDSAALLEEVLWK